MPLIVGCGALVSEIRAVLTAGGLRDAVDTTWLPAHLHNRPDRIVDELRNHVDPAVAAGRPVFVAYADCGTGGRLDAYLATVPGVERLPGAHCYETFAGSDVFAAIVDEELGTLYLTDFLAKHFDALLWQGLGLDRHPELLPMYFGNYRRVVLLSQTDDPRAITAAREAAERLGLAFERRHTGLDPLRLAMTPVAVSVAAARPIPAGVGA
jgi:hypothetical protein